jgi:signal transduction histidine kinase
MRHGSTLNGPAETVPTAGVDATTLASGRASTYGSFGMTESAARRLAWTVAGIVLVLLAAGAVLHVLTRDVAVRLPFAFRGSDILMAAPIGAVGVLIATRRRTNPIGWLLLATSVVGASVYPSLNYVLLSLHDHSGSLPGTPVIAWIQNWLWVPMMGMISLAIALFPDGHFLTRRWRNFFVAVVPLAVILFSIGIATPPESLQGLPAGFRNPYAMSRNANSVFEDIGGMLFLTMLVGTVIATIKRFRRATGVVREQMKWLVPSLFTLVLTFAISMPIYLTLGDATGGGVEVAAVGILFGIVSIPVSMGIAILRHRLYDINVVINKALVFAALAGGITAAYALVVFGVGAAVGSSAERPNVGLSVAATALVAVAFQPLRAWARRVANRVVYGKRATPHDVLSVLGEKISEAYSLDDVLPRLAMLVTEATAASAAEVWLRVGGEMRPTAAWPHDPPAGVTIDAPSDDTIPVVPGAELTFPVRHQGELLGAIAVRTPANEQLTSADEQLLADLGSHAGLVLRNVRLIEELRASRQRLVSAQDAERRKIERNLHDGAQQHLVALSINLGLAETMIEGDPAQTKQFLAQLKVEAGEALENLRDLARGIYPPLLADRGLVAAITSQAGKAPVPTTVDAAVLGRYPMEVEAAIYFCVLEALQNVGKYARASSAVVRLAEENGHIAFSVTDDGAGFDAATASRGAGLTNMADRIEALGGRIEVASKPGAGTTVRGWVSNAPAV